MENMFILVFIWIKYLVGDGLIWWFPIYTDLVTNRLIGCHKFVLVVWSFSSCFRNWKIIKISLFKRESPSWSQTPRQCWAVMSRKPKKTKIQKHQIYRWDFSRYAHSCPSEKWQKSENCLKMDIFFYQFECSKSCHTSYLYYGRVL